MEIVLLACVMAVTSAAVLVLLPSNGQDAAPTLPRHARRLARRAHVLLGKLGKSWLVEGLMATRQGEGLAVELAETRLARELGLGREEMGAALVVGFAGTCVLSGFLMGSLLAAVVVAAALLGGVMARDIQAQRRAHRETIAEMPGIYRTLSMAMASGQTLAQAVEYVGAHERGPAAQAFARLSLRLRCGMGTEEAVGCLSGELEAPGCDLLATALVVSHRTGSPLRDLLLRSAKLVERQGEFERLLAVKTAQVRLSVRIVCLLPAAMIAILTLISPDFRQGLLTLPGISSVLVAALLDGLALLIIRRLVTGVL